MTLISISVRDADADTSSVMVHVQDGEALADYVLGAQAIAALVDPIVDGQIVGISVNLPIALPGGIKTAPVANCEVQKGGNFTFAVDGRYQHGIRVPSLIPSLFVLDGINLAHTDVEAFTDIISDGTGGSFGDLIPHNGHNEDILAVTKGVKSFRKG